MLAERGILNMRCSSAGLIVVAGVSPPPDARIAARRFDVAIDGHVPTRINLKYVADNEVVLVMEPSQLVDLRRRWPRLRDRYYLLPLFSPREVGAGAYERHHLSDPYGRGPDAFYHCYERIHTAVQGLVAALEIGA